MPTFDAGLLSFNMFMKGLSQKIYQRQVLDSEPSRSKPKCSQVSLLPLLVLPLKEKEVAQRGKKQKGYITAMTKTNEAVIHKGAHNVETDLQTIQAKDRNAIFKGRCCFHRSAPREAMASIESVDALLANKDGLDAFRAFLKSEFSEENIEFWLACEDFKKTKSAAKIVSKAQRIYSDFIQADAPKEFFPILKGLRKKSLRIVCLVILLETLKNVIAVVVVVVDDDDDKMTYRINIDFNTRDRITQTVSEPTLQCFDDAQRLIYSLMAKDSFPRFLRSQVYKDLVNKQQNGNQKRWLPFL
ncbi:Regulator of G-protein signaling 21 [Varanus komodoensis]|nr:Regulator of G-protein signaling 21 [Varanus komodoensis]